MPRNVHNTLKIANYPGKKIHIIARGTVGSMFIVENNSRSKVEADENKPLNMIHSTLKTRLFFGDSLVSKESTSYKLYIRLKFVSRHTEVI